MNYFRAYPWGLQFLLFVLMGFTLMWFGGSMAYLLLPKITGINLADIENINDHSPTGLVDIAIKVQGLLNFTSFFVPAFLFAYLAHPRPSGYLGLQAPGKNIQAPLAILLMLGVSPLLMVADELISHINFGSAIKKFQADNDSTMSAFLNISDLKGFIRVFTMMAIVPAFGEELFFRGVLMRMFKKRTAGFVPAIALSAFFFAFMHFNVYGFLSIFAAGFMLATIYYLTGSIWCSILAHMFFNGFQIILSYMGSTNGAVKSFIADNSVPYYLVIVGLLVSGISFYLLLKYKTPLTPKWTDDFEGEEKFPGFDFGDETKAE
jgi:membrane protease YdiL (CAAX protease family)